ncbi:MAG: DNA gyrase subunit A [Deltaproteobacteria bacterium]|nr:DNA gyrase subunit A [Deltaproteobacteria bacterium]
MKPVLLEEEMRTSYLDYAMSVIIGRALPDVRDGLKPVHRRVLFAMNEATNFHNRPYKKSARIVGDVIGKYHPHGDSAVYDSIVRLAQPFSMRELLVDGQGNFGSIDGDPAAAMRYTEIRLTRLAGEMLADLDKDTVDFVPNYDDNEEEPVVLPNRFPNLLVNGSQGIAVGMATSIPTHNLGEVVEACIALIRDPSMGLDELMALVPGPDFPTGGIICGRDGIRRAYETGRGSIRVRGVAEIEERKRGGYQIVITELPYQVNKARLIERIAALVGEKKLDGISDARDESDREGLRIVIELKRDAVPQVTLNQLWSHTALESTFGVNMLAIVHGQPRMLMLRDVFDHFIEHRRVVVTRRTVFELNEAERKFHILIGLLVALDNIDRVIAIIRASTDTADARENLIKEPFRGLGNLQSLVAAEDVQIASALEKGVVHLTVAQAQAILDLRLHRLTALESDKLRDEAKELRDTMARLRAILADDELLMNVIVEELTQIRDTYANPRRTVITGEVGVYTDEDLIAEEDMVVTISNLGYAKRTPTSEYRAQRRGGRGVAGVDTKEEDFVERLFTASTHDYLLVFTNLGKVYWIKVHELPLGGRTARGRPLVNLIQMAEGERVSAILSVREFSEGYFVMTVSRGGIVKKSPLSEYSRPRATGIIGAGIAENDEIIAALLTTDDNDILLGTRNGMGIRFKADDVRSMGRPSVGVRGIRLDEGDQVVGMAVIEPGGGATTILTVTENGYGKRTPADEYRAQGRGGRGIILGKASDRIGPIVTVRPAFDGEHIMVITGRGVVIRMRVSDVSVMGRNTQGVRVVRIDEGDRVCAVASLAETDGEATADLAANREAAVPTDLEVEAAPADSEVGGDGEPSAAADDHEPVESGDGEGAEDKDVE